MLFRSVLLFFALSQSILTHIITKDEIKKFGITIKNSAVNRPYIIVSIALYCITPIAFCINNDSSIIVGIIALLFSTPILFKVYAKSKHRLFLVGGQVLYLLIVTLPLVTIAPIQMDFVIFIGIFFIVIIYAYIWSFSVNFKSVSSNADF